MRTGMTARDAKKYRLRPTELYSTFAQLPLALSRAGVCLEKFDVYTWGPTKWRDIVSNTETLAQLSASMQGLKKFVFEGSNSIARTEAQHLTTFIRGCVNTPTLRKITLRPSGFWERPHALELPLASLINPATILENLTKIDLHEIICQSDEIAGFITRLPPKLKVFDLGHVRLVGDGTWEPVLDLLRQKKIDDLSLYPLYGGECDDMEHDVWVVLFDKPRNEECEELDQSVIEKYILRRIKENPLTSHRLGTWEDYDFGWSDDGDDEDMDDYEESDDDDMGDADEGDE